MFGISFADNLDGTIRKYSRRIYALPESTELVKAHDEMDEVAIPSAWNRSFVKLLFFLALGVLLSNIFTLQIIKGKYYKAVADGNGLVRRPIEAARGVITDRDGKVLVRNTPYFTIGGQTLHTYKDVMQMESTLSAEQKKKIKLFSIREYQYPEQFSHSIGYISPITQKEIEANRKLSSDKKTFYSIKDLVGRTGVEEQFEEYLRGEAGAELVEVNALGEVQKVLGKEEPQIGYTVVTTLHSDLQNFIYNKLAEYVSTSGGLSGVVIVQDPNTGHILSLANFPSYNNNAFTHPEYKNLLNAIFADPKTPLLNRAISGAYPPGSTFKMVTALAGLESKKISTETTYEDTGSITLSGTTFNNWYFTQHGKNDGSVDVRKALARSNDTFFYKMSLDTGVDLFAEQAHKFRFGQILGIDIPGETKGIVPTPEWKLAVKNEQWYPGNTVNMSIGQGDVLTTPLQISAMTVAIANNGTLYPPILVNKIHNGKNDAVCERDAVSSKWVGSDCEKLNKSISVPISLGLMPANLDAIQDGMRLVTQRGGTATPFFDYNIETAGKTGTAESFIGKHPHAWYTGYAPYNNPEITVTVLIEQGGGGSKVAAPLAKEIIDFYFTKVIKTPRVAQTQ